MSQATEMLQRYIDAEAAVLAGQIVRFTDNGESQELTLANLAEIRAGRIEWQRAVNAERNAAAGRSQFKRARFAS